MMMDDITIITPTRDRIPTFRLCRKWVERQTVKPAQWIVVDDGDNPLPEDLRAGIDYIRREHKADDPEHTIRINVLTGFVWAKYQKVIIVEDDDWYHPEYLEKISGLLDNYELAGQGETIYYHFPWKKWLDNGNVNHCSLCQTGFRKEIIDAVKKISQMSNDYFLDLGLWQNFQGRKFILGGSPPLVIGMKGLPGKQGYTSGWKSERYINQDPDYAFLRKLVGNDVEDYIKLMEEANGTK